MLIKIQFTQVSNERVLICGRGPGHPYVSNPFKKYAIISYLQSLHTLTLYLNRHCILYMHPQYMKQGINLLIKEIGDSKVTTGQWTNEYVLIVRNTIQTLAAEMWFIVKRRKATP